MGGRSLSDDSSADSGLPRGVLHHGSTSSPVKGECFTLPMQAYLIGLRLALPSYFPYASVFEYNSGPHVQGFGLQQDFHKCAQTAKPGIRVCDVRLLRLRSRFTQGSR